MVLEGGYALRASDIHVVYVNGYGFPGWRGGPMFYADSAGLKQVASRISSFEHVHGERWKVGPLLQQLAEAGKIFRSHDE